MKPSAYRSTLAAVLLAALPVRAGDAPGPLTFDRCPGARFAFAGPIGERIQANVAHWLLVAPQANPGMLEMFRVRDRKPAPQLVPWAGEFVGKYLLSAVQALRLSEDPRLRAQVAEVVAAFIGTQADDGYLGPFPRQERLLKHWDLWGHYHAIQALLMWHEDSGDAAALTAARRAADLVCATYLDTDRRVFDAGDPEMNMAILTGLAMLHRRTGEPRYLRMAREVEKDWERAGDYLRAGLDGQEFFRSPRPRWESLHDLQGLLELWRITGEAPYREAFEHHWRSLRRWDRRNTGGFSSGEQATGNPYAPTPIETCCTVAWMALTLDYLRLTGDARAADDLELATLNGGLGAQHPSGRWWTYNTPMDGAREASAHSIVFQARAGTPELNCCSVNAPRVLGLLSEWAIMEGSDGLVVNSYLPGQFTLPRGAGLVTIKLDRDYLRSGSQRVSILGGNGSEWSLRLRIPAWSTSTRITASFEGPVPAAPPGAYAEIRRRWGAGDEVVLDFNCGIRPVAGANEVAGKVSLYRGPMLLAYDQAENPFDDEAVPSIDLARLGEASLIQRPEGGTNRWPTPGSWLTVDVPAIHGRTVRLVDFASAGARGTRYRSWLPAQPAPTPPAFTQRPPDAARVPLGPVLLQWRGPGAAAHSYRVEFSGDESFGAGPAWSTNVVGGRAIVDTRSLASLVPSADAPLWWRVVSRASVGETIPEVPPAWFRLDPAAPPQALPAELKVGPSGELIVHSLRRGATPQFGTVKSATFTVQEEDGTEVHGRDQRMVYAVPAWPEEDFTVSVRVRLTEHPRNRIGQVFSAWTAAMDDPLRLVVDGGELYARVEAGNGFSTPGAPVEPGRWYAVAAVKRESSLTLYLNGQSAGSCAVPAGLTTQAEDCALGGNPHYSGDESLAARFADFRFHARALSPEEIGALAAVP